MLNSSAMATITPLRFCVKGGRDEPRDSGATMRGHCGRLQGCHLPAIPSLTLAAAADTVSMTETSLLLPFSHGAPGPVAPTLPGVPPKGSAAS